MPPKKVESKSKGNIRPIFSENEKALCEQQLADCNQKLARLRQTVCDYEIRNQELQKAYDTLDEDRADIISYLKKTLNVKTEESVELKEKIKSLEELKEIETAQFKETINELESNFTKMKDQLSSENKLLAGKLNTLEELRAIREDLMVKFENLERAFEEQEIKYKRIIYETEKKFIIGKDKLKKEMEGKLQQLAQEFQDGSELRIAASTHRVIRENIALNNQLDTLLFTQAKTSAENERLREDATVSRCAMEVAEEERDKAIRKSNVQLKVIDHMTAAFEDVRKQKALFEKKQFDTQKMQSKIQRLAKGNENLLQKVRVLEQNLHATMGEQNKSVVETAKLLRERQTFKNILKESAFAVQAALQMDHWGTVDRSREILDREIVLRRILAVINQYREAARVESMDSLVSFSKIYEKGDLGYDVKPVPRKSHSLIGAAGVIEASSQISYEDKRSDLSVSSSLSTSKESIKTVPSIELLPFHDEASSPISNDSLPSFIVASLHSSYSPSTVGSEESEGGMTDVSKMLAISRVEMQKSLVAELTVSQISQIKLSAVMDSKSRLDTSSHKSVTSVKGETDGIEEEHRQTVPEEGESEPVQDRGTEDKNETVQNKDADAGEVATVVQETSA